MAARRCRQQCPDAGAAGDVTNYPKSCRDWEILVGIKTTDSKWELLMPRVTKTRLNYSFSSSRNGILSQSIRNSLFNTS